MPDTETSASFFVVPKAARLRWLVYVRWLALLAVAIGLVIAHLGHFPWVAPRPIAVALVVGVLYNLTFLLRVRRFMSSGLYATLQAPGEAGPLDRELELQALADVGALTLLLMASGGVRNPVSMY